MNIPYVMKKCNGCGRWLVASTVNFHRTKNGKYGLRGECKECKNKKSKQWREDNPEYKKQWCEANKEKIAKYGKQYREDNKDKILEQQKQYRENNKDKITEYAKQYRDNNKDKITEQKKRYYEDNKEKIAEYHKQWYEANKDKIAEYHKQWYEANKDKIAEQKKQWRENNKERIAEQKKQYYKSPQGQAARFNAHNRRRHKKEAQGTGATGDQWLEMMQYFDWRCAYTGKRLTKKTRSVDHIVAIDTGGDDMIWNMVPMTRSLNSSKCAKDMVEWYKEQDFYSEARLAKIYEWQEYARKKWKNS